MPWCFRTGAAPAEPEAIQKTTGTTVPKRAAVPAFFIRYFILLTFAPTAAKNGSPFACGKLPLPCSRGQLFNTGLRTHASVDYPNRKNHSATWLRRLLAIPTEGTVARPGSGVCWLSQPKEPERDLAPAAVSYPNRRNHSATWLRRLLTYPTEGTGARPGSGGC